MERYTVLKINGLTKKVLLEIDREQKLYKKYDLSLFDENVYEGCLVDKYKNVDQLSEFIFITYDQEK